MAKINLDVLEQFRGTEQWFTDNITGIKYTDGIKYIMDNGASWFASDTFVNITFLEQLEGEEFLHIKVKKLADSEADYTIDDGNDNILYSQHIPFTDLNVPELRMYFTDNVLMLPSEY